jgi:uncharacterized UBP type Zn finger protein
MNTPDRQGVVTSIENTDTSRCCGTVHSMTAQPERHEHHGFFLWLLPYLRVKRRSKQSTAIAMKITDDVLSWRNGKAYSERGRDDHSGRKTWF